MSLPWGSERWQDEAQQPGFVVLRTPEGWRTFRSPLRILEASTPDELATAFTAIEAHLCKGGEAAGLLHYEAGYALEPSLRQLLRPYHKLCWFGLYDGSKLHSDLPIDNPTENSAPELLASSPDLFKYEHVINQIRSWIEQGDLYQLNYTFPLRFRSPISAWNLFRTLYANHPVPYAAFLNTGNQQIVSLSPELFFTQRGSQILVRPMKGTARRGLTLADDKLQAQALLTSEKERAENVMIVDLMRSDLGRIARTGSVHATQLFSLERYPTVWQMTSTIEAALRPGTGLSDVIRALFPSGSVTGAPKIQAMGHIAQLESTPRGVYTGAIGYVAAHHAQFNVAIRTAVLSNREGVMGIGSGITYSSRASDEWDECRSKASFLTRRIPPFQLIETILWDGGFQYLDQHLARMRDSAEYFDYPFNEDQTCALIAEHEPTLKVPSRIRVLLSRDGVLEITSAPQVSSPFGQVTLAQSPVNSSDRFLYHKTTHRLLYTAELARANALDCDDALFFNERHELAEGAIHNVFLQFGDRLLTPPVSSGLLPGILRGNFIASGKASEAVLTREHLLQADAIYLGNSVRGLYAASLI